jgi:hypothetical protein
MTPKPLLELELRPVEAPSHATPGARVFVLLPPLDELVGRPGFGASRPILCGAQLPYDPRMLFARMSRVLH